MLLCRGETVGSRLGRHGGDLGVVPRGRVRGQAIRVIGCFSCFCGFDFPFRGFGCTNVTVDLQHTEAARVLLGAIQDGNGDGVDQLVAMLGSPSPDFVGFLLGQPRCHAGHVEIVLLLGVEGEECFPVVAQVLAVLTFRPNNRDVVLDGLNCLAGMGDMMCNDFDCFAGMHDMVLRGCGGLGG